MTKQEYDEYQAAVANFMEREKLENLSSGHLRCTNCDEPWDDNQHCPECGDHSDSHNEPFFSWRPCECCGTSLGGDREHATGYNREDDAIQEYTVCTDCIYYAEYGQLDDMTMMDME